MYKKFTTTFIFIIFNFIILTSTPKKTFASTNLHFSPAGFSLPYLLASHSSVVAKNNLYVVNGSAQTANTHSEVQRFNFSTNTWINTSSLNPPLIWHTSATNGQTLYNLGGYIDGISGVFSPVYTITKADLNTTNSLDWEMIGTLPPNAGPVLGKAFIVNNRLYYAGGSDSISSNYSSNVYFTEINDDGNLGNWKETIPLPFPLQGFGLVVYGNRLFVLGGRSKINSNTVYLTYVYTTTVNSDGTLNPWKFINYLPESAYRSGVTISGNKIFVVGGINNQGHQDNVFYATIDSNGNLSEWETSDPLPHAVCCGTLENYQGYLYLLGGEGPNPGNYLDTVYSAKISDFSDGVNLNVPLLLQTDSRWANEVYDSAYNWATNGIGIREYGCATTSSAMILSYYGHNVNPSQLNSYLINNSGYTRMGYLIWSGVTRYAKNHDTDNTSKLEYRRAPFNTQVLKDRLNASEPVIIKFRGHFLVVKGYSGNNFFVNDPNGLTNTLDQAIALYGNPVAMDIFIPSETDLSYIYLSVNEDVDITVKDQNGNQIDGYTYTESPIQDFLGTSQTNAKSMKIFQYPKPEFGNYEVILSNPDNQASEFTLDYYLFDKDGNLINGTTNGIVYTNNEEKFIIDFNENSTISSNTNPTFGSIYKDLEVAFENNWIAKRYFNIISIRLKKIQEKSNIHSGRPTLSALVAFIERLDSGKIDPIYQQTIVNDLNLI